jgi:predicted DNA-binding transcriptional regulator AlpA
MKRKARFLMPRREVLRRTNLELPTLRALVRSGAFPSPTLNGRWCPAAVDQWITDSRRRVAPDEEFEGISA